MRALRAHDLTGPPGLWVDEIAIPQRPDENAVRIEVHAAGIGFVDTLVTRGKYQVRQELMSQFLRADRTTTTGQGLWMIREWLVEPSSIPANPPRPWLPTTSS
jgi:hypothetical protein